MNEELKVLILTNLFPNPEQPGRGNFIALMVRELKRYAKITVISPLPWFPNLPILKRLGSWYQFAKIPFFSNSNGFPVYYPKYMVIPKLFGATQTITLALSAVKLVRRLVAEKKVDIINVHWVYPDGVAAVWIAKQAGVPVVISARGSDINLYGNYRFRRPQIKWALKNSDRITAVSKALSEKIVRELGVSKDKVIVIPNGVDSDRFRLLNKEEVRKQLGLEQNRKYLLFVGRLHEVKGLEYLIKALSILKMRKALSFETILIGDGHLKKDLKRLIETNGVKDKVSMIGEKPNAEIPLWMNACDILCLPSKLEGLPNVILEANACGLPVVASKVGGILEILRDDNGICVKPQDSLALADSIELAMKKYWNREMISQSVNDFSWVKTSERYLNVFNEILTKHGFKENNI